MISRTQIVDTTVEVNCPDRDVLNAMGRRINSAEHRLAPAHRISLRIDREGGSYVLPSGHREIAPEIAVQALWQQINQKLQTTLSSWLQISGVCIDHDGRRLLVLGDLAAVRKLLALHCLCSELDVPSADGICLRDGIAVPYALPTLLSQSDVLRFTAHAGFSLNAGEDHDETGTIRYSVTPFHFGRQWIVDARQISIVARLTWNPGGWSGVRRLSNDSLLESILEASYLPHAHDLAARLPLLHAARTLAASATGVDLRLGRPEAAAPLLMDCLRA